LLEKAHGDINLAVEMFYSQKQCATEKFSGKEASALHVKAFVPEEADMSLPIEKI
jgi:hypothetical protein